MKKRIFVVDDSKVERVLLCGLLEKEYVIEELDCGEKCLASLGRDTSPVSAILLDIMMPGMDGYQVLEQIKKNPAWNTIPVIVITGMSDETAQTRALSLGAAAFISKPFNQALLLQMLRNTIELCERASFANHLRKDKLTGLYNRETFLFEASRLVTHKMAGFYVIDCLNVDHFKAINDVYGIEAGDVALCHIAQHLHEVMSRLGGLCCRVAGDVFGYLYPNRYVNSEDLKEFAYVAARPPSFDRPLNLRFGRYVIYDPTLSCNAMLDRAILAQESIKGHFDTRLAVYDESMRAAMLLEQRIVNEMRTALESGEFEPWFQPQYNHATGALIGSEALVRWHHSDGSFIPVCEFLPIFERNGFIYELDKFIWERVCQIIRSWIDSGRQVLPVSVNISRYDILRHDCVSYIINLVDKYHLSRDLLRLEITESAFSESTTQIVGAIKALISAGFTVEIDDFGSGYSSLNTLKNVPASVLKLDMRFLEGAEDSQRGGNILESIVRMAKWLGMADIAEGVETREHADFLKSIGCFYVQGYFYSRPIPLEEYEKLIVQNHVEEKLVHLMTVDNLDNSAFWDPKSTETLIFNSYIGGACIFEYHNGKVELLRINERYVQEFGGAQFGSVPLSDVEPEKYMDDENKEKMHSNLRKAIETGKESMCELFLVGASEENPAGIYLTATARVIARTGDHYLFYCVISNITKQRLAEKKQRELSSALEAIMGSANGGITAMRYYDGGVAIVFSNDKYYEQMGYTREQFESEVSNALDLVFPEDRVSVETNIAKLMRTRSSGVFEYRIVKRDGSPLHVRCYGSVTQIDGIDGDVMVSVVTDITELVRTQEASSRSASQLQAVLENINGGVAVSVVRDGKIKNLLVNDKYFEHIGYTREEYNAQFKGRFTSIHPDDQAGVMAMIRQATIDEKPYRCEFRVIRKDGSIGWLFSNVKVCHLAGIDEPVHLAVTNDVTELRRVQLEEKITAQKLASVLKNINSGVMAVTNLPEHKRDYLFTNDALFEMFGYSPKTAWKDGFDMLAMILPEDRAQGIRDMQRIMRSGGKGSFDYRCRKKDGQIIHVRNHTSICRIAGVKDNVYLSVLTDITDEQMVEDYFCFVNGIARDILAQPYSSVAIDDTLHRLREFFDADRSYVVEIDIDSQVSNITYEVCRDGVSSEMERLQGAPYSVTDSWFVTLNQNEYIRIDDVEALGDDEKELRELLQSRHIHSLICAPVFGSKRLMGYVGIDNPSMHTNQLNHLEVISDFIAILLMRRNLFKLLNMEQIAEYEKSREPYNY